MVPCRQTTAVLPRNSLTSDRSRCHSYLVMASPLSHLGRESLFNKNHFDSAGNQPPYGSRLSNCGMWWHYCRQALRPTHRSLSPRALWHRDPTTQPFGCSHSQQNKKGQNKLKMGSCRGHQTVEPI
ncbi:dendrin [Platysternon megacephalum]|uniref:Dendrin n=1 Tax=Platysternon megacephalum TaxID=55544 RepID=A0A4D9E1L2_9SAUR|nr:dendrin [Platysternon megacephalum]